MIQSDALSWRSDHDHGDTDNEDILMLPDSVFVQTINISLLDWIRATKKIDTVALQAQNVFSTNGPWLMRSSPANWSLNNELLLYHNAVYVPPDESL